MDIPVTFPDDPTLEKIQRMIDRSSTMLDISSPYRGTSDKTLIFVKWNIEGDVSVPEAVKQSIEFIMALNLEMRIGGLESNLMGNLLVVSFREA